MVIIIDQHSIIEVSALHISECCDDEKKCNDETCIPNIINNCENWCPKTCQTDEKLCVGKMDEKNCKKEDICVQNVGKNHSFF